MSGAEATSEHGRVQAVHDWLARRADTSVGRLALQWFRAYFAASRSSGCAATVYSALSVLPAVLVVAAVLHPSSGDSTVFAQRLVTHLKLNGPTASLVQGTFGSASTNALAASLTVFVSFLLWGIGIGQIYQDVYARAWGIKVGSLADQGLFAIFFFVLTGVLALAVLATARLHDTGWLVLVPVWLVASTVFWLWVPRFLLHRKIGLRALLPGALLATVVLGGTLRHLAVLPGISVERERQDLRRVRGRDHVHRRSVRVGHDVARVRGLLAGVGELARDREATPRVATDVRSRSRRRARADRAAAAEADAAGTPGALGRARAGAERLGAGGARRLAGARCHLRDDRARLPHRRRHARRRALLPPVRLCPAARVLPRLRPRSPGTRAGRGAERRRKLGRHRRDRDQAGPRARPRVPRTGGSRSPRCSCSPT